MTWLEFAASFLDSLAWPALVAFGILLLRREIRGLLSRLSGGSYEDAKRKLHFDFGHQQQELVNEARAAMKETTGTPTLDGAVFEIDAAYGKFATSVVNLFDSFQAMNAFIAMRVPGGMNDVGPLGDPHMFQHDLIRALIKRNVYPPHAGETFDKFLHFRDAVLARRRDEVYAFNMEDLWEEIDTIQRHAVDSEQKKRV